MEKDHQENGGTGALLLRDTFPGWPKSCWGWGDRAVLQLLAQNITEKRLGTASLTCENQRLLQAWFCSLGFRSFKVQCVLFSLAVLLQNRKLLSVNRLTASAGEQELWSLPNNTQLLIYLRVILIISHHNNIKWAMYINWWKTDFTISVNSAVCVTSLNFYLKFPVLLC